MGRRRRRQCAAGARADGRPGWHAKSARQPRRRGQQPLPAAKKKTSPQVSWTTRSHRRPAARASRALLWWHFDFFFKLLKRTKKWIGKENQSVVRVGCYLFIFEQRACTLTKVLKSGRCNCTGNVLKVPLFQSGWHCQKNFFLLCKKGTPPIFFFFFHFTSLMYSLLNVLYFICCRQIIWKVNTI